MRILIGWLQCGRHSKDPARCAPRELSLHTGEVVGSIPTAPTIAINHLAELFVWIAPETAPETPYFFAIAGRRDHTSTACRRCSTEWCPYVLRITASEVPSTPATSHVEILFCSISVAQVCLSTCGVTSAPSPAITRALAQARRSWDVIGLPSYSITYCVESLRQRRRCRTSRGGIGDGVRRLLVSIASCGRRQRGCWSAVGRARLQSGRYTQSIEPLVPPAPIQRSRERH